MRFSGLKMRLKGRRPKGPERREESNSAAIDKILEPLARKLWMKNSKRRKSPDGTAGEIMVPLNMALATKGLKPLGRDAIRKRVQKLLNRTTETNVRLILDDCIDVQLFAVATIFKNKFRPYPGAMALDAA